MMLLVRARMRPAFATIRYDLQVIWNGVLLSLLVGGCAGYLSVTVPIIDLEVMSFTSRNLEGVGELTFSTLVVGIGELGPECEFRASGASENTSSSASDVSEITVSSCIVTSSVWKFERRNHAPRSWAPESSSSTLLRGGTSVGLLGG